MTGRLYFLYYNSVYEILSKNYALSQMRVQRYANLSIPPNIITTFFEKSEKKLHFNPFYVCSTAYFWPFLVKSRQVDELDDTSDL